MTKNKNRKNSQDDTIYKANPDLGQDRQKSLLRTFRASGRFVKILQIGQEFIFDKFEGAYFKFSNSIFKF